MKTITSTLIFLFTVSILFAQGIFDSSIHTAIPIGDVNSPATESSQQIIDQDPMTKYLDFNIQDGMSFEVDLGDGNAEVATSMAFVTANDAPERDPINYEILGSNDSIAYTSIASGTIPCVADRFLSRIFTFTNETAYTIYQITFTNTCNTSSIIQVADVQLFTLTGNAPVISCPTDIVLSNTLGACGGVADYSVMVTDVEDGSITPTLILGEPSGSTFPLGTSPVVYSAADSDGNGVSCEFFITVEDTEAPSFDCPDDRTVNVSPGETSSAVNFEVSVTDNCSAINAIDGFIALGTLDGKSYYVSDSLFTPENAAVDAFENGGFVGTIRSQADNDYLLDAIAVFVNEPISVLIGYSDELYEGSYLWASGDASTYTNWNEGEPNNSGAGGEPENYTVMLNNGFWNDVTGDPLVYRYLLEGDFAVEQTAGLESGEEFPLGVTTNTFSVMDASGNVGSCSFDITVEVSTNVVEQILSNKVSIAPNPTTDGQVNIVNDAEILIETILVYDVYGKLIHKEDMNLLQGVSTINLSDLSAGVYLLEFVNEEGSATQKLVKTN